MELKNYQVRALKILENFLSDARRYGSEKSFEAHRNAPGYNPDYQPLRELEGVPYVCLRLPTGGGKTLMGVKAIQLAAENYLYEDYPFVLWLVPSNEIRQQTLKVLKDTKNFYNQLLYRTFNGRVQIFDVTDFRRLRPHNVEGQLNICVATFQSFKVEDKEGRKVYQGDEELEACFANIARQEYFQLDEKGRYCTFANLIAYLRPLMIVDEAHNNSTALSFDTTKLLRPATVIELTATPAVNSNVLVNVSAKELNLEAMIKLPVILGEVYTSSEQTLTLAVQKREELEKFAANESEYIRPIALYQAESKNREFNVDFVRNYLINDKNIPAEQVAVATGDRRELDGKNLFARDCKIRHIITVQALKEGWDCPFASVFCSVANTHSAKDAEQLLGRVLRMPYAKRRKVDDLNKAYVFLRAGSWGEALNKLKDDLFAIGFDKEEVKLVLGGRQKLFEDKRTIEISTQEPPNTDSLNIFLQNQITVTKADDGYKVTFKDVTDENLAELTGAKNKIFKQVDDRDKFLRAVYQNNFVSNRRKSPAERGVVLSIPQLCLDFGDGAEVARRSDFFPRKDWSLTGTGDYTLPLSRDDSDVGFYELDLKGNKLTEKFLGNGRQILLPGITKLDLPLLVYQLVNRLSYKFSAITYADLVEFTRRVLDHLMHEENFTLAELERMQFAIQKALRIKIDNIIDEAYKSGWEMLLFDEGARKVHVASDIAFVFSQKDYPARNFYKGSAQFSKHYHAQIGAMNSEEVLCAQCIDANPNVEVWIRNIEREPKYSFWLQTHKDKFYPDFVVKLKDGTSAAIEYKGAMLKDTPDTKEKKLLGEIWARKSNGACKFLMAVESDKGGRNLSAQVNEFLVARG